MGTFIFNNDYCFSTEGGQHQKRSIELKKGESLPLSLLRPQYVSPTFFCFVLKEDFLFLFFKNRIRHCLSILSATFSLSKMGAANCEDEDLEFRLMFGEEEKDPQVWWEFAIWAVP